jgi:hypothetical protein
MIVSLLFSGKGVKLFVHDVMGNLPILEVLTAFSQKAVQCVFNSNCCYDEKIVLDDCTMNNLKPQSGIETDPVSETSNAQEQNVGFSDLPNNVISSIPHPMEYVKVDKSVNVELGDFLKRPVRIYTKNWAIGNTIDVATSSFNPWFEYFNKPSIKKKLDNYYMVRCNLHLKIVVNASPFYYGCVLAAYQPLINFNPAPVIVDATRNENVSLSQRPHIYIYPQNSQGGEMVLPFLYHKNWLDASSASTMTDMGQIDLSSFGPLKNANGLTSDSIDIVVYAWAEGLEVSGPTIKLALQSGKQKMKKKDEYSHEGTVSKPASAIARAAGHLSTIPVIGPFATATSYAADAIADIASLFGYTDVPVIDDVCSYRPKAYPNLAATDIGTTVEKLTLDSKNELTIDPKIAGADVDDELMIKNFTSRESFIFSSTWAASDAIGTGLFFSKVTPQLRRSITTSNGWIIWSTPMDHVMRCFSYWRGDIIYRFKFICSQYHRGRVQINWDPIGSIGTSGDYTTETYTRIVDISEENDVEFCVPYIQPTSYLRYTTDPGEQVSKTNTSTSGVGAHFNGILTVRVLNEQTSPVTSADIDVLVFVRGSDNLEFAAPRQISSKYSPYAAQSGVVFDQDVNQYDMGIQPSQVDDNLNLVYMGETCVSLRQLMRRSCAYKRLNPGNNTSSDFFTTYRFRLGRSPQYPGFDPAGFDTAIGLTSAVSEPYNWTCWSYVTWFSQCFVGSRGSYHYTINPNHVQSLSSVQAHRMKAVHNSIQYLNYSNDSPTTNLTDFRRRFCDDNSYDLGMSGMALTNQRTLAGNMVSVPLYSTFKFLTNNVATRNVGTATDGSNLDSVQLVTIANSDATHSQKYVYTDLYVSAGTDFNLIFFLNVPAVFLYDYLPAAV